MEDEKGFYLIMAIIIAFLIGAAGLVVPSGEVCGDVNCDGGVDSEDVSLLLNHVGYPGEYPICSSWAADVTCDGSIDVSDPGLLQYHIGDAGKYPLKCCVTTTTTTTTTTTSTTLPKCTDSDGGRDYYVKGKGTGLYGAGGDTGWIFGENPNKASARYDPSLAYSIYYDHCFDSETSNQLNEAYCDENGLLQAFGYNCPYGCRDGVCLLEADRLEIEITSPDDGETVSGIVEVKATAEGPSKLDDMYLTIARPYGAGNLKLTDCIDSVTACKESSDCNPTYTKICQLSWDTSSYAGERVTLTASISDVAGNEATDSIVVYPWEEQNRVDVDIYPETQTVRVGSPAEYKVTVTDNHPIARCGIALADEVATEKSNTARCVVYYTYNIEVTGLYYDSEYPKSVAVYQGSSKTISLTVNPDYTGKSRFSVKATLSSDPSIYGSDMAVIVVTEYQNCNLECERRGFDYGTCRASCTSDEYDIGTSYCLQVTDKKIVASERRAVAAAGTAVEAASITTATAGINVEPDIYMYPTYSCCCGNKGITVKAWPSKTNYESGETPTIYSRVYSEGNGDIDAEVTGTIAWPDKSITLLTFKKICAVAEVQKIKEENPAAEISCMGGKCWPSCIYVATGKPTDVSGHYSVKVKAESSYGSVETTTGFQVGAEVKSCNDHCQQTGYDYGVCRTSCREDEVNAGTDYCLQLTAEPYVAVDESDREYPRRMYCCCGNLIPPHYPGEELEIELFEGWNLITLPGEGELSLGTCEALYGFVYVEGEYMSIKKAKEMLGEKGLLEYLKKHSFWAYAFKKCSLEFILEEYSSYTELELLRGWNFLPIAEDMVGKSLQDIEGECELQKPYYWNARRQRWDSIDPENKFSDEQKFQGIITKAADSCNLGGFSIRSPPLLPEG